MIMTDKNWNCFSLSGFVHSNNPVDHDSKQEAGIRNVQRGITPYRAHAHERYSSMNRVPDHDFPTFFMLHRTKCKPMHFEYS